MGAWVRGWVSVGVEGGLDVDVDEDRLNLFILLLRVGIWLNH